MSRNRNVNGRRTGSAVSTKRPGFALLILLATTGVSFALDESPAPADPSNYLSDVSKLCEVQWPNNRMIRIVCHGHSVPAGYFKTPEVRSLDSYPHLIREALAKRYPHAVINVIVTAIGGENSEGGAKRFDTDVLVLKPDVVLIDYSLNDRGIGLERARAAWSSMIERAVATGARVICLTPTPDLGAKLSDPADPLNQQAEQVRQLAAQYHVGLVDSLHAFNAALAAGTELPALMSQVNHPNRAGHELVARAVMEWFR